MKNFRSSYVKAEDLMVDDHIKVAGMLYRITKTELVGKAYIIQMHNVRRPIITGLLTLQSKTLMKIWNQK